MKVICTGKFLSSRDKFDNARVNKNIDRFFAELQSCPSLKDISNISKLSGLDIYVKRITIDMRLLFSIEGDAVIILDLMKHR